MEHCEKCDMIIDTDYDTEHVDTYCPNTFDLEYLLTHKN